jgi:hypothetical protein
MKKKARSLYEFAAVKTFTACAVCRLAPALQQEIAAMRDCDRGRFNLTVVTEWLRAEHGIRISVDSWQEHNARKHAWQQRELLRKAK